MKKVGLYAIGLAVLSLAIFACKKEEEVQADTPQATETPSRLVFETAEDYEALFENSNTTDEKIRVAAARVGFSENARMSAVEDTLYPEVLQQILNSDKIVEIGDWLIKVDVLNEQVLVLPTKHEDQYADLASSNLSNSNILVYSTGDEVLEMLQEGVISENARTHGWKCKDKGAEADDDPLRNNIYANNSNMRIKGDVKYRKYGIYFRINVNVKKQEKKNGFWTEATSGNVELTMYYRWKPKCRDEENQSVHSFDIGTKYLANTYSSSRALNKYDFWISALEREYKTLLVLTDKADMKKGY